MEHIHSEKIVLQFHEVLMIWEIFVKLLQDELIFVKLVDVAIS